MPKKEKKHRWSECPSRCSGRDASRQRSLTSGEIERLKEEGVSEISQHFKKCMYCGCVYTIRGEIFGWLDGMNGGWDPVTPRSRYSL